MALAAKIRLQREINLFTPESRAFLEEVAMDDPSADLRENARNIVDAWWGDESGDRGS